MGTYTEMNTIYLLSDMCMETVDTDKNPKYVNDNKCFTCDIRDQKFNEKQLLKKHSENHIKEKPCYFDSNTEELSHEIGLNLNGSEKKTYSCDVCGKIFSLRKNVLSHYRFIHADEKPFSCDICGKKYCRKNDVKLHYRTHTNEKPFSCNICYKGFSWKSNLIQHSLTHTNEKPFSCFICQRDFSRKCHLNEHLRIHTKEKPFSCEVCGKKFSRKDKLKYHLKLHINK